MLFSSQWPGFHFPARTLCRFPGLVVTAGPLPIWCRTSHDFTEPFLYLSELDGVLQEEVLFGDEPVLQSHAGKIPGDIQRKCGESREHRVQPSRLSFSVPVCADEPPNPLKAEQSIRPLHLSLSRGLTGLGGGLGLQFTCGRAEGCSRPAPHLLSSSTAVHLAQERCFCLSCEPADWCCCTSSAVKGW